MDAKDADWVCRLLRYHAFDPAVLQHTPFHVQLQSEQAFLRDDHQIHTRNFLYVHSNESHPCVGFF